MANTILVCVGGDWSVVSGAVSCTGTIEQVIQAVPTEITYTALVESFAYGFALVVPVVAAVYGGRIILSMLR